jgi:hypothetical protein
MDILQNGQGNIKNVVSTRVEKTEFGINAREVWQKTLRT